MRVLRDFRRHQGLLLSGAVAYYTLLSIVPMSILALIGLSHYIEEEELFHTLSTYLEMVIPGYATTLTEQVRVFLQHRKVIGIIGFVALLFFSSLAFTALENAMSVIFYHRVRIKHRHFLDFRCHSLCVYLCIGSGYIAGVVHYGSDRDARKQAIDNVRMEVEP